MLGSSSTSSLFKSGSSTNIKNVSNATPQSLDVAPALKNNRLSERSLLRNGSIQNISNVSSSKLLRASSALPDSIGKLKSQKDGSNGNFDRNQESKLQTPLMSGSRSNLFSPPSQSAGRRQSVSHRSTIKNAGSDEAFNPAVEANFDIEGAGNPLWRDNFLPKLVRLQTAPSTGSTPFEVDYIGTGTFQVSQLNLLTKRSIEPIKTSEGNLSARGLHHRSREQFEKDVKSFSHIISNSLRGRKMVSSAQAGTSSAMADFQLLPVFVQRALAYERLNDIEKAIADYNTAISIDPQFAPAYFNRSGLYGSRGDMEAAFRDINKAVELDPSNMTYRRNRTILFRQRGDYTEAIRETMLCRAVQLQPSIAKELKMGNHVLMDSDQLLQNFKGSQLNDPILEVLALPVEQRRIEALSPVVDFLAQVKIFKNYTLDRHFLNNIAINLEMKVIDKDVFIYRHLERSRKFYIVYDGEVGVYSNDLSPSKSSFAKRMGASSAASTANSRMGSPRSLEYSSGGGYDGGLCSVSGNFIASREIAVISNIISKGGFFGEAALESTSILRPGDSKCLQSSTLFVISGEQFQSIFAKHKLTLQREVRIVLGDCIVFREWDPKDLDSIAATVSVQRFSPGSDILKAGDPVTKLLIIRSGVVKFVRTMNRPEIVVARAVSPPTSLTGAATYRRSSMPTQMPYSEAEEKEGAKPPGIWVREKNWKELLQMFAHEKNTPGNEWHATAGVLGSGQVFGQLAVLQADATNGGARSPTSAIAYTEVELFSIDGAVLVAAGARFKASSMNALNDSFNLFNPPAEKVAYYMKAKFEWEKKRSKIVAAVMKDRKTKK